MPIKIVAIEELEQMKDGQSVQQVFATLHVIGTDNNITAAPRIPIADLPADIQVGDFLKLIKGE
jgi:hypothetical protein